MAGVGFAHLDSGMWDEKQKITDLQICAEKYISIQKWWDLAKN